MSRLVKKDLSGSELTPSIVPPDGPGDYVRIRGIILQVSTQKQFDAASTLLLKGECVNIVSWNGKRWSPSGYVLEGTRKEQANAIQGSSSHGVRVPELGPGRNR